MEVSSLFVTRVCHSQHTTVVCWGGGLNKYQPAAGDGTQRPLVPRSRCLPRLSRSVGQLTFAKEHPGNHQGGTHEGNRWFRGSTLAVPCQVHARRTTPGGDSHRTRGRG